MFKKREWTKDDIKLIEELYSQGKTMFYIAKNVFHCRQDTISNIIQQNKIERKNKSRFLSLETEKEICDLYLSKKITLKEIASLYGITSFVVRQVLLGSGIKIRRSFAKKDFNLKEDYFEKIDTPEKAYFLGFLFADGNVFNNQIALEIHVRDKEILEKLKQEVNTVNQITYRKRKHTEVCCLRITSQRMCEDLKKYGIVPNKTVLTTRLPQHFNPLFLRDYLRGLVDGDGYVIKTQTGRYCIGFVSNYEAICLDFRNYCNMLLEEKSFIKIIAKSKKTASGGYTCNFSKQSVVKQLATILYKDSIIYLTRKYAMAESIFM